MRVQVLEVSYRFHGRLVAKVGDDHTIFGRHFSDEEVPPNYKHTNKHCRENNIDRYPTTLLYAGSSNHRFQDGRFGHSRSEEDLFAFWFTNTVLKQDVEKELQNDLLPTSS